MNLNTCFIISAILIRICIRELKVVITPNILKPYNFVQVKRQNQTRGLVCEGSKNTSQQYIIHRNKGIPLLIHYTKLGFHPTTCYVMTIRTYDALI